MAKRKTPDKTPPAADSSTSSPPPAPQDATQQADATQAPPPTQQTPDVPPAGGDKNPPAAGDTAPKRTPIPDPFGIAKDYVAGVQLLESRQYRQMQIKFDEKPSAERIEEVKNAGYRWNGQDKVWVKPVQQGTAYQTRVDAQRLFEDLAEKIRQEKGEGRTV